MQDEAAIPEDILDQKHIDDKDDNIELDQTADYNTSDMTIEGSTSLKGNFEEQQKYAKNSAVRSIGPMTFKASSKRNNLANYNKPIKVDNKNNNNMNLYNNHKKGIKEMQLEKTAIGDIENVACNEDESFANTNSNMKALQSKQQENAEAVLSESVIDRDKSVHNIRSGQTLTKQQQDQDVAVSKIQMAGNVNRSRKQRRNLPEMKFGHRRDAVDLYASTDDENVDVGVGGNGDSDESANALSSPAIAGTPAEINDYKNDYLNIFNIRNNTSTPNVRLRLPLGQVQNKVLNGTSTERVAIEEYKKRARTDDDANPSSIVSSSTFEEYKSKQRNNGHKTGHKTHKKKYKDYLRYAWSILHQTTPTETVTERATIILNNKYNDNGYDKINATIKRRQRERAQKLEAEKSRGFQVPPIFTITSNQEGNMAVLKRRNSTYTTNRPFYEGQINYYLETKDDEENIASYGNDSKNGTDGYRRNSPMLRNGLRRTEINHMQQNAHHRKQHQHTHHFSHALHQRHHNHHHHQQHQHQHQHHQHQHHHHQQRQPAGKSVLGHQITDAEDFERYYAKWPHLARVQFQVYDEHLREQQQEEAAGTKEDEYPEYEYGSVAEMEEAQKVKPDEDNLPPYVRKYNRRNKQLLDLLEGPLPPPKGYHWSGSKLQPGPAESSDNAQVIRLDDDYMREKRRRHQFNENFFAQQQQQQQNNTTTELNMNNNHLPDEQQQQQQERGGQIEITHVNKLIGNEPQMTWQIEKLLMPTTTTTTTTTTQATPPKALVFRLPTFNSNQVAGHAGLRQRSRSAGQRRYMSGLLDSMELHGYPDDTQSSHIQQATTTTLTYPSTTLSYATTTRPLVVGTRMPTMPPRSISAFVYHRVVDNSPRQVGAGGALQGRKQQLPFVAITDRRLETFKKSLLERQKEFEQNNFPPLP